MRAVPCVLSLIFTLWRAAASAAEGELVLARDGQAQCAIVIPAGASDMLRTAAADLQKYLGRIAGADFCIAEEVAEREASVVSLGSTWLARHAIPARELAALGEEGFLIRRVGDALLLAAREDYGVQHAVYTLLERLGCRWFWPGEAGEVVPRQKQLVVGQMNETPRPSFAGRLIWYAWGNRYPTKQRAELQDWNRRNKMVGSLRGTTGHAYSAIASPAALFGSHPEYFPLAKGRRVPEGQLCTSNAEIPSWAMEHVRRTFRKNPTTTLASLSPNDGGGGCPCKRCRAIGSMSDQALALANAVAERAKIEFPGRYVGFYAYYITAPPPALYGRKNVLVSIATAFITGRFTFEQLVDGWSERVPHLGAREYYSVLFWSWDMPSYKVDYLAQRLRYFRDKNVVHVSAESGNNWASNGLDYYVAARLMWNVDADVGAILADYYEKCWAEAAEPMQRYFSRWARGEAMNNDTLAQSLRDLGEAAALAKDDRLRRRVDLFRLYLHHVKLYRDYLKSSKAPHSERVAAVRALVEHDWRMTDTNMIQAIPLIEEAVFGRFGKTLPPIPQDEIAKWKRTDPFTAEEVERLFREDVAAVKPVDVAPRAFSENLVPVTASGELHAAHAKPAYRGRNQFVLLPEPGQALQITVDAGTVGKALTQIVVQDSAGAQAVQESLAAGTQKSLSVPIAAAGLCRMALTARSSARVDFAPTRGVVAASQKSPLTLIGGTGRPIWFYVPKGVPAFAIGLQTPDQWGRIQVWDADGEMRLDQEGNYVMEELFRVDVPAGQGGRPWSLAISKCEDSALYLVGVPPWLAQHPSLLLVPSDAARHDASNQ